MKNVMKFVAIVALACVSPAWADDVDGDGVDDTIDVCNNTPPGTTVDTAGRPWGDLDQDCDNDLDDYALYQQEFTGPLAPPRVAIETVPVGNPGNADDTQSFGGVDYVYNIGRFEVTAGQYTRFLNAVADADTYGLYNASMWNDSLGCKIERTGSSPNYEYRVADDWAVRPVNYVSWGDAARFANWLHNGQPTGAQDLSTTEDGSYCLDGATSNAELVAIVRDQDATWVIPSEDEWYKAAYHKNDGVTGNYFDNPTNTNSDPSNRLVGPDPGNNANFSDSLHTIGSPYYRTVVGDFENSESPYDTLDQGGNVWEWTEEVFGGLLGVRGGSFDSGSVRRIASLFATPPSNESGSIGFRVASSLSTVR